MLIELFVEGNKVIARATWMTESVPASGDYNTPTDPTTVWFKAKQRGAAATTYTYPSAEVTKVGTGVYELALVYAHGFWWVHAQGTGTAQGAGRISFQVDESEALAA